MKVLYAIQGTGNGHLSRARDVIPALQKHCEIDILVSGYQSDVQLPFKVDYQLRGLSFIFGKKGGVDVWNTYVEANAKRLRKEIKQLPIEKYDFVINDFEPVSAWASYLKKKPCISLSHQSAVLNKNSPKPGKQDLFGKFILKNYAPSSLKFGIHFCNYSKNIFTPVIRYEIRNAKIKEREHYTVYLPSYNDKELIKLLGKIKNTRWQIFSKHNNKVVINKNVEVYPISNEGFIESMTSSTGVLCGAGFETPAEALFLGKKLMVVPMKGQYEQQCNAAALKAMGVPVIKKVKESNLPKIQEWIDTDLRLQISYPNVTDKMVNSVFEAHIQELVEGNNWNAHHDLTFPTNNAAEKIIKKFKL